MQDLVGHCDLAQVVNASSEPDQLDLALRQPHRARDAHRMVGHALRMLAGIRVATVDDVRHRLHRGDRLLPELQGSCERDLDCGDRDHHRDRQPRPLDGQHGQEVTRYVESRGLLELRGGNLSPDLDRVALVVQARRDGDEGCARRVHDPSGEDGTR